MAPAKCGSLKGSNYCKCSWQALSKGSSTLRTYLLNLKMSQKKTAKPKEEKIANLSLFIFFSSRNLYFNRSVDLILYSNFLFEWSDSGVWGYFGNYYFKNNKTVFWLVCPPADFLKMHAINQKSCYTTTSTESWEKS